MRFRGINYLFKYYISWHHFVGGEVCVVYPLLVSENKILCHQIIPSIGLNYVILFIPARVDWLIKGSRVSNGGNYIVVSERSLLLWICWWLGNNKISCKFWNGHKMIFVSCDLDMHLTIAETCFTCWEVVAWCQEVHKPYTYQGLCWWFVLFSVLFTLFEYISEITFSLTSFVWNISYNLFKLFVHSLL